MGYILYIVASLLWLPLSAINLVIVLIKNTNSRGFLKTMNNFFMSTAVDIDKFGNRNFRTVLNTVMIKDSKSLFGNWNETISSVLGKNQRDGSLTKSGRALCTLLDLLDKDHCKKSIQN